MTASQEQLVIEARGSERHCWRDRLTPATSELIINGTRQPGDQNTIHTFVLGAARCFVIHRRADFARHLYAEATEVPTYDTREEWTETILHHLPHADERVQTAAAVQTRVTPANSIDSRAEVVSTLSRTQAGL